MNYTTFVSQLLNMKSFSATDCHKTHSDSWNSIFSPPVTAKLHCLYFCWEFDFDDCLLLQVVPDHHWNTKKRRDELFSGLITLLQCTPFNQVNSLFMASSLAALLVLPAVCRNKKTSTYSFMFPLNLNMLSGESFLATVVHSNDTLDSTKLLPLVPLTPQWVRVKMRFHIEVIHEWTERELIAWINTQTDVCLCKPNQSVPVNTIK